MWREKLLTLWSVLRTNLLASILGGVGAFLIFIGLLTIIFSSGKGENNIIFEPTKEATGSASITIDIEGAVVSPGVYQLKSDARLQDGLIAAGGLSGQADREWVARNLNLAVRLKDGTKVYIPDKTQNSNVKSQNYAGEVSGVQSSGLVNINTASLSELDKLPGIGPVTGQKIVDNRPYNDVNELLSKKIVGNKVFAQIKEKITTY